MGVFISVVKVALSLLKAENKIRHTIYDPDFHLRLSYLPATEHLQVDTERDYGPAKRVGLLYVLRQREDGGKV